MPKFAHFDPNTGAILNWMDTDALSYAEMPPAGQLLELTDAQYEAGGNVIVKGAKLVPFVESAPAIDPRVAIQAQIDALERDSMTNRGARELQLELMREKGAANGLQDDDAIAAKVPYFKKLLALDVQIRALRAQL